MLDNSFRGIALARVLVAGVSQSVTVKKVKTQKTLSDHDKLLVSVTDSQRALRKFEKDSVALQKVGKAFRATANVRGGVRMRYTVIGGIVRVMATEARLLSVVGTVASNMVMHSPTGRRVGLHI